MGLARNGHACGLALLFLLHAAGRCPHRAEHNRSLNPAANASASTVAVDLTLSEGVITAAIPGRLAWLARRRRRAEASAELREAIATWPASESPAPHPAVLPDLVADDFDGFARALGEVVAAAAVRRRRRHRRQDLAFRVQDGALQPLPWELALQPENGATAR